MSEFINLSDVELNQIYNEELQRKTGRTTRLVDSYIQKLFTNQNTWITIKDHHNTNLAAVCLADKIVKRLEIEHGQSIDVKKQLSPYGIPTIKLCVKSSPNDFLTRLKNEIDKRENTKKISNHEAVSKLVDEWCIKSDAIGVIGVRNMEYVDCCSNNSVSDKFDELQEKIIDLEYKLNNNDKFVIEKQNEANIEFNAFKF